VLHEQKQELPQTLVRGVALQERRWRGAQFDDFLPVDLLDEGFARLEVAIQRADCDAGSAGDVLDVGIGLSAEKRLPCRGEQGVAVALRVGAYRS